MIVLYTGRRGAGKTTSLVKDAYLFYLNGWKIISNMESLTFASQVLQAEEILQLLEDGQSDFVIVIDEIQTFIDSRRSMKKKNVNFAYFIQQIRKRNVIILAATQFASRVDKAFREHVDIIARPHFYPDFPVVAVNYYDYTILEDIAASEVESGYVEMVFDPTPVYPLFDTTEVIVPSKQ